MNSPSLQRRGLLGLLAGACLPAVHAGRAQDIVVQTEPSLRHGEALLKAALQSVGYSGKLIAAPNTSEQRNLYETRAGRIHVTMLPPTVTRLSMAHEGQLRMIPVPLERGLLGWRTPFVLKIQQDRTENVKHLSDLRHLIVGQGAGWVDAKIYRRAGVVTRELQAWRNGEFAEQMRAGVIHLFPMGLEESVNFFLPHFQQYQPDLILDTHLILRYPWYRFIWVSSHPDADAVYSALQEGFDTIIANGVFESIWNEYRQQLPASQWRHRRVIDLDNPFYSVDIVPKRYQHLLLDPEQA